MAESLTAAKRGTNVVPPLTSFVGRSDILRTLGALLGDDAQAADGTDGERREARSAARLVTLLGPPGMGKTRLAQRFVETHAARYASAGGAWFCDLTGASALHALVGAIGAVLDRRGADVADDPIEALAASIASRGATLLVLDNFEGMDRAAAEAVAALCRLAPDARVLVTSRVRLRVPGEVVIDLPPLALPTGDEEAEAVTLFRDRARDAGGFGATGETAASAADEEAIAALVRALDGIPLAIELAASRSRVLGIAELRARVARSIDVLGATDDGRHRTLRAAIEDSWDALALAPALRAGLAQCATFESNFTADAGESVVVVERSDVLALLSALCDRSLLTVRHEDGETRFAMYASIREVAREKAAAEGFAAGARARHRRWFVHRGRDLALVFERTGTARARAALARERLELEAIVRDPTAEAGDVALAVRALAPVLEVEGPHETGRLLLERGIAAAIDAGDAETECRLRIEHGNVFAKRGDAARSLADYERGRDVARAAGDRIGEAWALAMSAIRYRVQDRIDEALAAHAAAFACLEGHDAPRVLATNCVILGLLRADLGHEADARAMNARARGIFLELGDAWCAALAVANVAQIDQAAGAYDAAAAGYRLALETFARERDATYEARYLGVLGTLEVERGDDARARETLARAIATAVRHRLKPFDAIFRGARAIALARLGDVGGAFLELDAAEASIAAQPWGGFRSALHLHRAHAALVAATADGTGDALTRAKADARAALEATRDVVARSQDARFAARLLERAVGASSPPALVVASDGATFRVREEAPVALGRRANLRRILVALAKHRLERPGAALAADVLLARGWPGERVLAEAGGTRVRVAIATLRRLGLAPFLLTDQDGYLLDPRVGVAFEG